MRRSQGPLQGPRSLKSWVSEEEYARHNGRLATILPANSNSMTFELPRAGASDCQRVAALQNVPAPAPCQGRCFPRSAVPDGTPVPGSAAPTQLYGETASTSPSEIVPPNAYFLPYRLSITTSIAVERRFQLFFSFSNWARPAAVSE